MSPARPRAMLATGFLAACVAAGTSLLAMPASSAAPVGGASQAAARHAATASAGVAHTAAPSLATRQLPLLKVANEILERTGQGAVADYSGYGDVTVSVTRHRVTLYWHGRLPAALRRWLPRLRAVAPVRVLSAAYTWQQLEKQARQVARAEPALGAGGYVISRAGPAPDASGLLVGVDYARSAAITSAARAGGPEAEAAAARAAVRRLVPGPAPVSISDAALADATGTRNHDNSPWWGGSRIVRDGNVDCSTGFAVISGLTHYLISAGHCGGISTVWETGDSWTQGLTVGPETARNGCCDSDLIKVGNAQPDIYNGGWNSSASSTISGPITAVDGTYICTQGATSGTLCNIDTEETGQVVTFTNEDGSMFTAQNESLGVQKTSGHQADAGGDSGGPAIVNSPTPGHVYATGTISGGYGSVTCSSNDDQGVKKACYGEVWFEDIFSILNLWNVQLLTG